MLFLITAGPTREFIDPFRFISNPSSGRMGYALARAAVEIGQEVDLISGPVELPPIPNVSIIKVTSAREMREEVMKRFPAADVVIMAAAVSDYRPVERLVQKRKKSAGKVNLSLIRNPDILKELGKIKGRKILVGFSAETDNIIDNARQKMRIKNLDLVVANDLNAPGRGFASDSNKVTILDRRGAMENWPLMSKEEIADRIIGRIMEMVDER